MYYISTNFRNFILHTLHQRGVSWVLEYVPIKIFMIQNASISMFLLLLGTSYEKYRILSFLQKCKPLQNTSSKKFRNNPPESSQCPVDTRGIVYKPHFCTLIIYPPICSSVYTYKEYQGEPSIHRIQHTFCLLIGNEAFSMRTVYAPEEIELASTKLQNMPWGYPWSYAILHTNPIRPHCCLHFAQSANTNKILIAIWYVI